MFSQVIQKNISKTLSDCNMSLATMEVRDRRLKKWDLQFKLYNNNIYLIINNTFIPINMVRNYFNLYFPKHLKKKIKGIVSNDI